MSRRGLNPDYIPSALRGYNDPYDNKREGLERYDGSRGSVSVSVGGDCRSVGESVWSKPVRGIVRSGFDERFENRIRLSEVIVNEVHEE